MQVWIRIMHEIFTPPVCVKQHATHLESASHILTCTFKSFCCFRLPVTPEVLPFALTISLALFLREPITTITTTRVKAVDYPDIYLCLSAKDSADMFPEMENNFFVSTLTVTGIRFSSTCIDICTSGCTCTCIHM